MYLKQITMSGFLSFKETTVISDFSLGANIILGKNGSGKSNILSAIKFIFVQESKFTADEKKSYLYEKSQFTQPKAFVEILFDNTSGRFPSDASFKIRRTIDLNKDEITVNENIVTREEIQSLFEGAGFSKSNLFFIVPQGEVERLSLLDDFQRYNLVKEIAGASMYERDRSYFSQQFDETLQLEKKISLLKQRIDEKIKLLKTEQKKLFEIEKIDEEKNSIEKILLEKELKCINAGIKDLQPVKSGDIHNSVKFDFDGNQELLKSLREKLCCLYNEKKEISALVAVKKDIMDFRYQDYEIIKNKLEKLNNNKTLEENSLKKLRNELSTLQCQISAMEYEKMFLESNLKKGNSFSKLEIEECENQISLCKKNIEKIGNLNQETQEFSEKNYKLLINERKNFWIEEKNIEKKQEKISEDMKQYEKKIMYNFGVHYQSLKMLKNISGVHGCVYELISIPDEIFVAVSSIMGNYFFSIIVENDNVATDIIKNIDKKFTFIPLNRIKESIEKTIDDENLIPIWEQIDSKNKYRKAIRFLTSNTYLASDIKHATDLCKKYDINIVTLEGEYISKKGVMSGGYQQKNNIFDDFKKLQKELTNLNSEKEKVLEKIKKISISIESANITRKSFENGKKLDLKSNLFFLQRKLSYLKNGIFESTLKKSQEEKAMLEIKKGQVEIEKNNRENNINGIEQELKSANLKFSDIKNSIRYRDMMNKIRKIDEEIIACKKEEENLINLTNQENINSENEASIGDIEADKKLISKNILIEKKNNLIKKINSLDISQNIYEQKYSEFEKEKLILELKKLCSERKKFSCVNQKASLQLKELELQQNSLISRITELHVTKKNIQDFIEELDKKKDSAINLTFSIISENFSYFFSKLYPNLAVKLIKSNESVKIQINEENLFSTKTLSGGQKALLSLSLIFAIQRIDSSTFYVFDEIDANLDQQTRVRLCNLIKEISCNASPSQFIFTTFKSEMLECGKKFFGVIFRDKMSAVTEISRQEAENFLLDESFGDNN